MSFFVTIIKLQEHQVKTQYNCDNKYSVCLEKIRLSEQNLCFFKNRILNIIAIISSLDFMSLLFDADCKNEIILHLITKCNNCTKFALGL